MFIPTGAMDKDAAVRLLAWMTSPEILADAADAYFMLPVSQTSAQDARFHENLDLTIFMDLIAIPNNQNIAISR